MLAKTLKSVLPEREVKRIAAFRRKIIAFQYWYIEREYPLFWTLRYLTRKNPDNPLQLWYRDFKRWQKFWSSYQQLKQASPSDKQPLKSHLYPCLGDDTAETIIEPTYFYQDTWAFERIVKYLPTQHVDVGSHHKFVAFLSKVVPLTMVDIRPLSLPLNTLQFKEGSILNLPFENESLESLSSLCVVEHIGLGRYGDPLDPDGTEKAIAELKRVIKPGGNLYLSLPLDDENRIYFNAHRAFSETYIEALLQPFEILERAYIHGNQLGDHRLTGFCIGLYHLRNPEHI